MRDPNNPCLFCNVSESGSAYENDLAYASYDSHPVSVHHCLIIPKRHIKDYFAYGRVQPFFLTHLQEKPKGTNREFDLSSV